MRPTGDTGKFTVATDVEGGKTRVIVSALDKDDEFLNYQTMDGVVLAPDMQSLPLKMEQAAPGRYIGEFDSGKPGSYLISVRAGKTMIRTGVNIGYSNEFRDRETNTPLLKSIAELPAKGGERHDELLAAAARAYGVTIKTLATSLCQGGMRGVSCPNLRLDLIASETTAGTPLVEISNGHNGEALCRWLIRLLNAEWVDLWWMGTLGYAQITCDRDVHIGPAGSKRWDS